MIKRGSVVLLDAWGKRRLGVVLDMREAATLVVVIAGTTKVPREGDPEAITVEPYTRNGRALGLREKTFFKKAGLRVGVPVGECSECLRAFCPPILMGELNELVRELLRQG